jgi:hypothetical protein
VVNDIQKARDVLAKWRKAQTPAPWQVKADWTGDAAEFGTAEENPLGWTNHPVDARLIVGTAGNPDLLDAIDAMFDYMAPLGRTVPTPLVRHLEGIAAAIISADERMSA